MTELAKAITGWSVPAPQDFERGAPVRAFMFRANAHEGGSRVVMGKRYAEDGLAQGQAVLADLAVHPATARHVSWKIARHLVSDERRRRWWRRWQEPGSLPAATWRRYMPR